MGSRPRPSATVAKRPRLEAPARLVSRRTPPTHPRVGRLGSRLAAHHQERGSHLFAHVRLPPALEPLAERVKGTVRNSLEDGGLSAQKTALTGRSGWITFCEQHSLPPFPAHKAHLLLWLESIIPGVAVGTADGYLGAVRATHADRGLPWVSERVIRQYLAGALKEHPPKPRKRKLIVSPREFVAFTQHPPRAVDHSARVFDAATAILCLRGRRGGELWPKKKGKILRWENIAFVPPESDQGDGFVLTAFTKTSKAEGGRPHRIFYPALPGTPVCPKELLLRMKERSPFPTGPKDPIFMLADSNNVARPMRREFMISRTSDALARANIPTKGVLGSKSWRAGIASSATEAEQTPAMVKTLGIWKSSAYKRYIERSDDPGPRDSDILPALSAIISMPPPRRGVSLAAASSPQPAPVAKLASDPAPDAVTDEDVSDGDSLSSSGDELDPIPALGSRQSSRLRAPDYPFPRLKNF